MKIKETVSHHQNNRCYGGGDLASAKQLGYSVICSFNSCAEKSHRVRTSSCGNPKVGIQVQCCFASTETIRTIREGEPRTATSTFTQLLSSDGSCSMLLYVHRDHTNYCARGTQDGHLDELRGSVTAFKLIYFKCSFLSPIVKENLSFLCFVY